MRHPARCAPSTREAGLRAGAGIRWFTTALSRALPTSGRRCRPTKNVDCCSCRHRRRARISGAASGPAMTRTPIRWSRCAPRPENWCGRSRPRITMSGIMICRHSRRWRASTPATGMRDVVIQPTKQGFVFVLDRDTGKPIWPVEERSVPQGAAEGEQLSPTQPFPTHVPALVPQQILERPTYSGRFRFSAARLARNASQPCAMMASIRRPRRRERRSFQ